MFCYVFVRFCRGRRRCFLLDAAVSSHVYIDGDSALNVMTVP